MTLIARIEDKVLRFWQGKPSRGAPVKCAKEDGGIFDEKYVAVRSYDFRDKTFQDGSNMVIIGEKKWGYDVKSILKYLFLRFFGR